jgi:molecular chaperone IbpA
MRTNLDLTPFRRASVGFDRLFDMLENGTVWGENGYPPFDLEQDGEDRYRITLAVAGFRRDELDITAQQNLLIVSGQKKDQNRDEASYIYRGIAARSFERRFMLGDYVKVSSADMKDGLLTIELVREVPEEMKPKKIEISGASKQAQLTDQQGATSSAANFNQSEKVAA